MNRRAFGVRCAIQAAFTLILLAGICAPAMAQGFRGGGGTPGGGMPSAEESFRRIDTNGDGVIDGGELQQVDGFRRQFLTQMGIDGSRPVSLREYTEKREQAMRSFDPQQFRRPDSGGGSPGGGGVPGFGGPPGSGGGPPSFPSRSESDRGDGRRSEEPGREDRRDDRDRSRDERRESSSSSKSSKKSAKPKERVTKDLPADYREKDKNGDGQIGLYEWDRKAFAQFYALDRNGDGLLTPDELIAATKKTSSSDKSSSKSNTPTSIEAPSGDTKSSVSTSDTTKPSDSSSMKSASATATTESSPGVKSFVGLDSNRDGKLSEEEWRRSRTARAKFEKAKIELKFPVDQAQFVELYNKVEAQ